MRQLKGQLNEDIPGKLRDGCGKRPQHGQVRTLRHWFVSAYTQLGVCVGRGHFSCPCSCFLLCFAAFECGTFYQPIRPATPLVVFALFRAPPPWGPVSALSHDRQIDRRCRVRYSAAGIVHFPSAHMEPGAFAPFLLCFVFLATRIAPVLASRCRCEYFPTRKKAL